MITPRAGRGGTTASRCIWRILPCHLPHPHRDQFQHSRGQSYSGAQARSQQPLPPRWMKRVVMEEAEVETKQRLEEVEKSLGKYPKARIQCCGYTCHTMSPSVGERRGLLNDTSGWVVPGSSGNMSTLVGESGPCKLSPSVRRPLFPIRPCRRRGILDHVAQGARSSSRYHSDHGEPIRRRPGATCRFPRSELGISNQWIPRNRL